jgi:hypothetical protein
MVVALDDDSEIINDGDSVGSSKLATSISVLTDASKENPGVCVVDEKPIRSLACGDDPLLAIMSMPRSCSPCRPQATRMRRAEITSRRMLIYFIISQI